MKIPTAAELFFDSLEATSVVGVYVLFDDYGTVVYVGQSADVEGRISSHRQLQKIAFSRVCVIRCLAEELHWMESLYIRALDPKENRARPPGALKQHKPKALARVERVCARCRGAFMAGRAWARFCSLRCRQDERKALSKAALALMRGRDLHA